MLVHCIALSSRTRFFTLTIVAVLLLSVITGTAVLAEPTSMNEARTAVATWLRASARPLNTAISPQIKDVQTVLNASGEIVYHVVNLNPSGFVIVAGDDLVEPIIAFVPSGEFDPSLKNPIGALVSGDMPARIAYARASAPDEYQYPGGVKGMSLGSATPVANNSFLRAKQKWAALSGFAMASDVILTQKTTLSDVRVAPLVTSQWTQDLAKGKATYNFYTPPLTAGSKDNYICGCVATAMAQLMRFHEYPKVGVGTASYKIYVDYKEANRKLRGGNGLGGAYSWKDMPLVPESVSNLTEAQRKAIGALTHDAGVAVHMQYSASFSGAYMSDARAALANVFKYTNVIEGYDYENGLTEPLKTMMNSNLDAGLPVLLGISGDMGGHAIVGDGYGYDSSTLYHHLNLGWAGYADAWYNLPRIDVYADGNASFNVVDDCIYNVYTSGTGEIISGRVVDDQDKPISGATVTAKAGSDSLIVKTNEYGIYGITKLKSNTEFSVAPKMTGWKFTELTVKTGKSVDGGDCGNKPGTDFKAEKATDSVLTVTINQATDQADPTDKSPVLFTVEFSASVTGFEGSDVKLSGTAEATAATVKGEGKTYTIEVRGMKKAGTVIADVVAEAATDASANLSAASTSTDNTVTFNGTVSDGPTVTVEQASGQADPASSGPIRFLATFSQNVTGFTASDVKILGTAEATTAAISGSGRIYSISVSGMKRSGTVIASIPAGAAMNELRKSNSESTSVDNTVTYSNEVKQLTVVVNQADTQTDPARTLPIKFIAEFSQPVNDFTTSDVRVGGTATGSKIVTMEGSGNRYVILIKGLTKPGTVEVSIPAGVAHSSLGLANAASTSTDNVVTYDSTVTSVSINQAVDQKDPTSSLPIVFRVEFAKAVTGFTAADVKILGTAKGEKRVSISGSERSYTVEVSGLTTTGTVTAYIPAGAAIDTGGGLTAPSTSFDNTVMYKVAPTVTINQAPGQIDPTTGKSAIFKVVFSKAVNGFAANDLVLDGEAAEGAKVSVRGSGAVYSVEISNVTKAGALTASIAAEAARDELGVPSLASTSEDNTVTFVR